MKTQGCYRNFNFILILIAFVPLVLVGSFNYFIDPYQIFHNFMIKGVNYIKPEKFQQDRLYKAVKITNINPKTILLGSSKVQWGLPPNHPALSEETYNLGLLGANIYELRRYFEHSLTNDYQLQQVIIGIDFFMFNAIMAEPTNFNENILKKKLPISEIINVIFSMDSFQHSRDTFTLNRAKTFQNYIILNDMLKVEKKIFDKGGLAFHETSVLPGSQSTFYQFVKRDFRERTQYKLSEKKLNDLRVIVQKAKANNIEIKVFISPIHAAHLEAFYQAGIWQDFENWKREIIKITPVWDFATYNTITTEAISNNMRYFLDSAHYSQQAGKLILDRMLLDQEKQVIENFGIVIMDNNIEVHLRNVRRDQKQWAVNYSESVRVIQQLKRQVKKTNQYDTK